MAGTEYDAFVTHMRTISQDRVVARLMSIRFLRRRMQCRECESQMSLMRDSGYPDGWCWRCQHRNCRSYKVRISIRRDSFFFNMNSSLRDVFCAIYCWSQEKPIKTVCEDFGLSKKVVIKIFAKIRSIMAATIELEHVKLGGAGSICQIDESLFCHKVKAHKGRAPQEQVWVFGIIDASRTIDNLYLQIVVNRKAETLLPIISSVVRSRSIIHTDEWAAYSGLSVLGFVHKTVNHSKNFVNPITKVHTQKIESQWNVLKSRIKKMKGVRRVDLPFYLKEFMWRNSYSENTFMALIPLISILD